MNSNESIISVENLHKYFGEIKAVDDISLTVKKGEIFGFLGPNGAGKTTTVRLLTGILHPDAGSCSVAGFDPYHQPTEVQRRIGIAPEVSNAYIELTAWENMMLMGELYRVDKEKRKERGQELLHLFGLEDRKDSPVSQFSKGMKKRLNLAMSMMHDPSLLFLDEPTPGLDVQSQRLIRERITDLNGEGVTIFLTTHNMAEANQLCNRIAVINKGKVAAIDRPSVLKQTIKSTQAVEVSFKEEMGIERLSDLEGVERVEKKGDGFRLITPDPVSLARRIFSFSDQNNLEVLSIQTQGPSLEDVFLSLTGGMT